MRMIAIPLALSAAISMAASGAAADPVGDAFRLCAVFDATGLLSEKCAVSGWHSSVDVSLDMNSGEARKLCGQVAAIAFEKGLRFDHHWQIRIFSPYSGARSIAICPLD